MMKRLGLATRGIRLNSSSPTCATGLDLRVPLYQRGASMLPRDSQAEGKEGEGELRHTWVVSGWVWAAGFCRSVTGMCEWV